MTGQFASLDEDLTGRENLVLLARLWGFRGRAAKSRADDLLAAFDLADAATKQVKAYSGGMRRRLDIAASLIVTPGVLFLDEPTTGLDPNARKDVWKMIRGLCRVRRHHPAHHAISGRGRPARRAHRRHRSRQEDRRGHQPRVEGRDRLRLPACRASPILPGSTRRRALLEARLGHPVQRSAEGAELSVLGGTAKQANEALAELIAGGIELSDFSMGQPSLEEVFFALTGEACRNPEGRSGMSDADLPASRCKRSKRPAAPSALSNALVFGWRAVLKFRHVPEQLFDLVMTPIMFTLLFTFVFGGALAGSPSDYLQFFLPGILVQTVVFNSVYSGMGLSTDLGKGLFDRFRSLPIWSLAALRRPDGGRHPAPPDRRRHHPHHRPDPRLPAGSRHPGRRSPPSRC